MSALTSAAIGTCGRCQRPIQFGQAYMPAVPFVGSWGGFWHQYCPPRLVRVAHPNVAFGRKGAK